MVTVCVVNPLVHVQSTFGQSACEVHPLLGSVWLDEDDDGAGVLGLVLVFCDGPPLAVPVHCTLNFAHAFGHVCAASRQ